MTTRTVTLVRPDGTRDVLDVVEEQWLDADAPAPEAAPEPDAAPAPVVGMGATEYLWSDVRSYTVVAVSKSGKRCTVQRDRATLLNGPNSGEPDALIFHVGGFAGHVEGRQRWEISRDPEGEIVEISRRRDGSWRTVGLGLDSSRFELGKRVERYDFNF